MTDIPEHKGGACQVIERGNRCQHQENRVDGIGVPLLRLEDRRLLAGLVRFSDDYTSLSRCHAVMVRSPHAHARIRSINVSSTLELTGVLAALTGADAAAGGLRPVPYNVAS